MAYDGSIRIDTSIDDKSFNVGMAKLSSAIKTAMTGVMGALGKVVIVGAVLAAIVVALAAAFVVLALAVVAFGFKIITEMAKAVNRTSVFGQQIEQINKLFADVKGAIYGAFSPLIIAAIPYIIMAVNWLVKLLNTVQMIIAALLGQKTVMQYVAGSAASAATATGKLADNTSKAGKAAKGALAAFDQLNVLQQDTADTSGAGSSGGGAMQFTEVPITASVLDTVTKIKQWFVDAWAWIQQAWTNVSTWFKTWIWDPLMIGFSGVWAEIMRIWNIVAPWFKTNIIDPLAAKFNWLVGIMIENANKMYVGFIQPFVAWFMTYLWPFVKMAIDLIVTNIRSSFDFIVSVFRNVLLIISGVISGIITVIGGIIQFITGVFTGDWSRAWEGIKNIFKGIFEGIGAIVKGVVNTVIDFINMMIRAVAAGMNAVINGLNSIRVTIPDWVPFIGGNVWGLNLPNVPVPQIPRLATGAVIPPNSQFAAILGDQRSGTNIEAPADLIRQIVREELGGSQGGDMNITMPVYLDSEKIYEGQKRVSRRRGSSLVVGSTA